MVKIKIIYVKILEYLIIRWVKFEKNNFDVLW